MKESKSPSANNVWYFSNRVWAKKLSFHIELNMFQYKKDSSKVI